MITIRSVTASDLPALAHLWHEKMVLQADPRTALAPHARDLWTAAAQTWLDDPRCGFFAAERDQDSRSDVVGYIVGWLQPMTGVLPQQIGLITEIALDAHGYHGGVGRSLVSALREWFSARGAANIAVWTPHHDAVAQAFWRSLGAAEWMDVLWIR